MADIPLHQQLEKTVYMSASSPDDPITLVKNPGDEKYKLFLYFDRLAKKIGMLYLCKSFYSVPFF